MLICHFSSFLYTVIRGGVSLVYLSNKIYDWFEEHFEIQTNVDDITSIYINSSYQYILLFRRNYVYLFLNTSSYGVECSLL